MALSVKAGGSWHPARAVHVRASGAWRAAKAVYQKISGAWVQVWVSISVALSTYQVRMETMAMNGRPATASGRVTAQVTGGVAPFTYVWETTGIAALVGQGTDTVTIRFTGSAGQSATGTYRCTVTDATGASVTSPWGQYTLSIISDIIWN